MYWEILSNDNAKQHRTTSRCIDRYARNNTFVKDLARIFWSTCMTL